MKFTYFGYDFMLPAAVRLLDEGHELLGIFTFDCDNIFNFNTETIALGKHIGAPVIFSQPEEVHLDELTDRGCEVFIAAGFPAKIPVPDEKRAYAINMHPSRLPRGRGLMPTPTILMSQPDAAGLTIHKLTEDFDAGGILLQEAFDLAPDETVDSYSARIAARGPEMLSAIMSDLPKYWAEATPQDETQASTFPKPTDEMRTFAWTDTVETIDKITRAFGKFGSLCRIEGKLLVVYDLDISAEAHDFTPGHIIDSGNDTPRISARDGIIILKSYEILEAA